MTWETDLTLEENLPYSGFELLAVFLKRYGKIEGKHVLMVFSECGKKLMEEIVESHRLELFVTVWVTLFEVPIENGNFKCLVEVCEEIVFREGIDTTKTVINNLQGLF